ncbi:MAG: hypothetical protein K8T90_13155 [Planctomycetes bacterium]|nr:hypothetical protein [Planctomycetota bacterium]
MDRRLAGRTSFGNRRTSIAVVVGGAALVAPGCTATVLHDHYLGKERRFTTDWTAAAAWPVKPFALVGGVASDGLLGVASMALWPFDLVGIAGTVGWNTWQEGCGGAWWAAPVFPVVTLAVLPFAVFGEREGPAVVWKWFPPKRDAKATPEEAQRPAPIDPRVPVPAGPQE